MMHRFPAQPARGPVRRAAAHMRARRLRIDGPAGDGRDRPPAASVAPASAGCTRAHRVGSREPAPEPRRWPGSLVTVHYTGWLYDPKAHRRAKGTKFDSSRDAGGRPFQFWLGAGNVIRGWDEGVVGMKVGGHRRLVIPSSLGYGQRGAGGVIPPGAALVFDVELLDVRAGAS